MFHVVDGAQSGPRVRTGGGDVSPVSCLPGLTWLRYCDRRPAVFSFFFFSSTSYLSVSLPLDTYLNICTIFIYIYICIYNILVVEHGADKCQQYDQREFTFNKRVARLFRSNEWISSAAYHFDFDELSLLEWLGLKQRFSSEHSLIDFWLGSVNLFFCILDELLRNYRHLISWQVYNYNYNTIYYIIIYLYYIYRYNYNMAQ